MIPITTQHLPDDEERIHRKYIRRKTREGTYVKDMTKCIARRGQMPRKCRGLSWILIISTCLLFACSSQTTATKDHVRKIDRRQRDMLALSKTGAASQSTVYITNEDGTFQNKAGDTTSPETVSDLMIDVPMRSFTLNLTFPSARRLFEQEKGSVVLLVKDEIERRIEVVDDSVSLASELMVLLRGYLFSRIRVLLLDKGVGYELLAMTIDVVPSLSPGRRRILGVRKFQRILESGEEMDNTYLFDISGTGVMRKDTTNTTTSDVESLSDELDAALIETMDESNSKELLKYILEGSESELMSSVRGVTSTLRTDDSFTPANVTYEKTDSGPEVWEKVLGYGLISFGTLLLGCYAFLFARKYKKSRDDKDIEEGGAIGNDGEKLKHEKRRTAPIIFDDMELGEDEELPPPEGLYTDNETPKKSVLGAIFSPFQKLRDTRRNISEQSGTIDDDDSSASSYDYIIDADDAVQDDDLAQELALAAKIDRHAWAQVDNAKKMRTSGNQRISPLPPPTRDRKNFVSTPFDGEVDPESGYTQSESIVIYDSIHNGGMHPILEEDEVTDTSSRVSSRVGTISTQGVDSENDTGDMWSSMGSLLQGVPNVADPPGEEPPEALRDEEQTLFSDWNPFNGMGNIFAHDETPPLTKVDPLNTVPSHLSKDANFVSAQNKMNQDNFEDDENERIKQLTSGHYLTGPSDRRTPQKQVDAYLGLDRVSSSDLARDPPLNSMPSTLTSASDTSANMFQTFSTEGTSRTYTTNDSVFVLKSETEDTLNTDDGTVQTSDMVREVQRLSTFVKKYESSKQIHGEKGEDATMTDDSAPESVSYDSLSEAFDQSVSEVSCGRSTTTENSSRAAKHLVELREKSRRKSTPNQPPKVQDKKDTISNNSSSMTKSLRSSRSKALFTVDDSVSLRNKVVSDRSIDTSKEDSTKETKFLENGMESFFAKNKRSNSSPVPDQRKLERSQLAHMRNTVKGNKERRYDTPNKAKSEVSKSNGNQTKQPPGQVMSSYETKSITARLNQMRKTVNESPHIWQDSASKMRSTSSMSDSSDASSLLGIAPFATHSMYHSESKKISVTSKDGTTKKSSAESAKQYINAGSVNTTRSRRDAKVLKDRALPEKASPKTSIRNSEESANRKQERIVVPTPPATMPMSLNTGRQSPSIDRFHSNQKPKQRQVARDTTQSDTDLSSHLTTSTVRDAKAASELIRKFNSKRAASRSKANAYTENRDDQTNSHIPSRSSSSMDPRTVPTENSPSRSTSNRHSSKGRDNSQSFDHMPSRSPSATLARTSPNEHNSNRSSPNPHNRHGRDDTQSHDRTSSMRQRTSPTEQNSYRSSSAPRDMSEGDNTHPNDRMPLTSPSSILPRHNSFRPSHNGDDMNNPHMPTQSTSSHRQNSPTDHYKSSRSTRSPVDTRSAPNEVEQAPHDQIRSPTVYEAFRNILSMSPSPANENARSSPNGGVSIPPTSPVSPVRQRLGEMFGTTEQSSPPASPSGRQRVSTSPKPPVRVTSNGARSQGNVDKGAKDIISLFESKRKSTTGIFPPSANWQYGVK